MLSGNYGNILYQSKKKIEKFPSYMPTFCKWGNSCPDWGLTCPKLHSLVVAETSPKSTRLIAAQLPPNQTSDVDLQCEVCSRVFINIYMHFQLQGISSETYSLVPVPSLAFSATLWKPGGLFTDWVQRTSYRLRSLNTARNSIYWWTFSEFILLLF